MDAVGHQRMRRIERASDGGETMALLALRDVALGEVEIVENPLGVGPRLEQVVVLEEVIMAERRMSDDERLHRRRVFLHQVGNARRAVDHDLIGETLQALAIERFVMREMLAEGPMLVEQGHSDRRVGIEHLLGGDDLDLIRIDVEAEFAERDLLAGVVRPLQDRVIPVGALVQKPARWRSHGVARSCDPRRWKSSWNTGKISLRLLTLRIER